jgi:hypothetical protein
MINVDSHRKSHPLTRARIGISAIDNLMNCITLKLEYSCFGCDLTDFVSMRSAKGKLLVCRCLVAPGGRFWFHFGSLLHFPMGRPQGNAFRRSSYLWLSYDSRGLNQNLTHVSVVTCSLLEFKTFSAGFDKARVLLW